MKDFMVHVGIPMMIGLVVGTVITLGGGWLFWKMAIDMGLHASYGQCAGIVGFVIILANIMLLADRLGR